MIIHVFIYRNIRKHQYTYEIYVLYSIYQINGFILDVVESGAFTGGGRHSEDDGKKEGEEEEEEG